mgnify:CR=1 FL=1
MLVLLIIAVQKWGAPLYKQYFTPKKTEVYIPTTKVKEGKFVVSFHEIGTLDAERSVTVTSEINGRIISLVDEGQIVKKGDEIAVLDTTDLEREVNTETLEYENRLADVKRAQEEFALLQESNRIDREQAEAQLDFDKNELALAQQDLEKKKRLAANKLIPGTQVEQAEGTVRSKDLAVKKGEAQLQLKLKEIASKEAQKQAEIDNLEFRAQMAKRRLDRVSERMSGALITAPAPGLVVLSKVYDSGSRRPMREGDDVDPRETICQLPDLSSMLVKVQVGEADAPKVIIGMPVLIRLEAVPKKTFHGTVKGISALATESNPWEGGTPGKKNFEVRIAVKENDPSTIKPGMTADVEFIVDEIESAIFVPLESVIEQGGKTFVFVKEGGKFKKVAVKTGKSNDNFICITKGLKAGQVVALRDPTRDLEHQEAGSKAPGADKDKEKKQAAPIPGAGE